MLQINFEICNDEMIRGFTSTFVVICSANSYPFWFPSRRKSWPLDILKCVVTVLKNWNKKVASIRVDEYTELARSSEYMTTCHNMNIIIQNSGGDASSLNDKSRICNKKIGDVTRALLLNSRYKKELCFFVYQYPICLSRKIKNILCGDVTYLLWNVTRPSYKHIKIWVVRVYTINELVTRKNIGDIPHWGYFMVYAANTGVILHWKPYQPFFIHTVHHVWFD